MDWLSVGLAVLAAVLLLLVEHWFPWGMMMGRELPRLWAYVLGVLAMFLPLTGLLWAWDVRGVVIRGWMVIAAMWLVVISSGLAVALAWGIDDWLDLRLDREVAEGEREVIGEVLSRMEDVDDEG